MTEHPLEWWEIDESVARVVHVKRPGKDPGPIWQRRVREVASDAIRNGNIEWGRRYMSFLANQLHRLEQAFGPVKPRSPRKHRKHLMRHAVFIIVRAHPDWSIQKVAEALGRSEQRTHAFVREARKAFGIPTPTGKGGHNFANEKLLAERLDKAVHMNENKQHNASVSG